MAKPQKDEVEEETKKPSKVVSRGAKAEPDEPKERARKYPETLKIKVLNKENPHREGTGRADAFTAMLGCKTMGDYYETGHKIKYIQAWTDSKHIEVG